MGLSDAGGMAAQINGNRARKKFEKQQAEAAKEAAAQAAARDAAQARQATLTRQAAQSGTQLQKKFREDVLAQMALQSQTLTEIRDLLGAQQSAGTSSPSEA